MLALPKAQTWGMRTKGKNTAKKGGNPQKLENLLCQAYLGSEKQRYPNKNKEPYQELKLEQREKVNEKGKDFT